MGVTKMPFELNQELPAGARLYTLTGEPVNVVSTISREGGQGDVYRVKWKGGQYALKWYNRDKVDSIGGRQYNNIKRLTRYYADPGFRSKLSRFIWPQQLVTETGREDVDGLFGYVMELIPDGYYELKYFLRGRDVTGYREFESFHAMIWAGLHLITAVRDLHTVGFSYKDLNPGNVAVNPRTGHSLMVDCDNISVENEPTDVRGMRGYMAPEIVRSGFKHPPTIQSDQFSEAILLFQLFYLNHPFEGRNWARYPMHPEAVEDELYSIHPVYNMARNNTSNRPGDGWATSVIPRMRVLPDNLLEGFEQTFVNGIDHEMGRTDELRWLSLLSAARDQLVYMTADGKRERFTHFRNPDTIPRGCLRMTVRPLRSEIAIYPKQSIFLNSLNGDHAQFNRRVGFVSVYNGQLAIQNLSGGVWSVRDPATQKINAVPDNQWFPVKHGIQIKFTDTVFGVIDDPLLR